MATRYRLPEALGGGEYECVANGGELSQDGRSVGFDLPDLDHIVWLPKWILTKVEPPLQEQPPPGYYLIDADPRWPQILGEREDGYGWQLAGHSTGYTWDELTAKYPGATFTRLVVDPFVGLGPVVELPWEIDVTNAGPPARTKTIRVNYFPHPPATPVLSLESNGIKVLAEVSPDQARAVANALVTAANASDREQS